MPKLHIELDLSHNSFQNDQRWRIAAIRLREIAGDLERNSYDTITKGVIRARDFIPCECGTIKIST